MARLLPNVLIAACVLGALSLTSSAAQANGRFPRAQRLLEHPTDPSRLLLMATYGLVQPSEVGSPQGALAGAAPWELLCEASLGQSPRDEIDLLPTYSADGSLLVNVVRNLKRSTDGGCNFETVLGEADEERVTDFSLAADRLTGLAVVERRGSAEQPFTLFSTADGGATWTPLSVSLPEQVAVVFTSDLAPNDTRRFYISAATATGQALLLSSSDAGQTWNTLELNLDVQSFEAPYIARVHPTDPDQLWVRTDYWQQSFLDGEVGQDRLFYSADGGKTLQQILQAGGKLFGFDLSPELDAIVVGYGDPQLGGGRTVEAGDLGVYGAPIASTEFRRLKEGSVTCLTWSPRGLFVCASESESGYELGLVSSDQARAAFTSGSALPVPDPVLKLNQVQAPRSCAAGTSGAACGQTWPTECEQFQTCEGMAPAVPVSSVGGGMSPLLPSDEPPMPSGMVTMPAAAPNAAETSETETGIAPSSETSAASAEESSTSAEPSVMPGGMPALPRDDAPEVSDGSSSSCAFAQRRDGDSEHWIGWWLALALIGLRRRSKARAHGSLRNK